MRTNESLTLGNVERIGDYLVSFAMTENGCSFQIRFGVVARRKEAKDIVRHIDSCWNAVESIGGNPETVGELVEALEYVSVNTGLALGANMFEGDERKLVQLLYDNAETVLAKIKVTP